MCAFFLSWIVAIAEHSHFFAAAAASSVLLLLLFPFAYLPAWLIVSVNLFLFYSSSSNMFLSGRSIAFALHLVLSVFVCVSVRLNVEYSHYLLNLWMLICINTFTTYFFSVVVASLLLLFIFFLFSFLFMCYFADLRWRSLEMLRATCGCYTQFGVCMCVYILLFFRCVRLFFLYLFYSLIRIFSYFPFLHNYFLFNRVIFE